MKSLYGGRVTRGEWVAGIVGVVLIVVWVVWMGN